VTGTFAKEAITIGTMLQQQDSTLLNGSTVQMGTVQIYTEGSEMCYRAWPNATWLAFVISREQLHDYCAQRLDYVPSVPTSGVVSINPQDRRSGDRLLAALRDLDGSLRSLSRLPNAARVGESIEHDLLARIAGFLGRRPRVQASGDRRRVRLCGQILRETIALVERNPTEMLDLHSMSKATGLSPRTLQRTFQAEYGLSPQGWLRVERLNRVRADLLDPRQERSVTQTATRWGFFHLGRFSQYYRQLFGERPSATSARRAATHSTRTFEFSLSRSSNGGRADLS
jgi:AraC-like DNA-binding protein